MNPSPAVPATLLMLYIFAEASEKPVVSISSLELLAILGVFNAAFISARSIFISDDCLYCSG